MIPRLSTIAWMCCLAVAAFGLYMVKYRVQAIQEQIAQKTRALEEEREHLRVIAAEWAYLNRPDRLQALAEKYLELKPLGGVQLGSIAMLPYPGENLAALQPETPKNPGGVMPAAHVPDVE